MSIKMMDAPLLIALGFVATATAQHYATRLSAVAR